MVSQEQFRLALLNPEQAVPQGLGDGHRGPASKRFSVYRNNVVASLKEAMGTAFPLVHKLIGTENFSAITGVYVRKSPPKSPLMMHYGADFPEFLERFEPLAHLGYLGDCARLDLALRRSYHAADSTPVAPEVFADADALNTLRLCLAPSTIVLQSRWPLFDLWRFNMVPGSPRPTAVAQDVLIARSGFDPHPHLLPDGAAHWLSLLNRGVPFAEAAHAAAQENPEFDLAKSLTQALQTDALVQT